jgi:RNA polymerase sigma factor (sigma-70 family)
MKLLDEVAKHHKEWVDVVRSFGEEFYTEDIVQEMYLRINKYTTYDKIVKRGTLNKGYIYFVLRNLFLNYVQLKSRFEVVRIDDNFDISHDSYIEFENRIENEIASWHYYDEILFNLYIDSGMSIRKLAKETRISEKSIFVTLKKCKNKLKKYDKK